MTQLRRALLWTILLLAMASSALAQGWAVPARTPETLVSCAACPGQQPGSQTVGYKAPIAKFTGRIIDSTQTGEWFAPVRTFRAWNTNVSNNRLYVRASQGMIASYNLDTLVSRLEANEPMAKPTEFSSQALCCGRAAPGIEDFLKWDTFVHPEGGKTPGWVLPAAGQDGSERVLHWDVDDQGYVYTAASVFGWGINRDIAVGGAGSLQAMATEKHLPASEEAPGPSRIVALKSGGRLYAVTGSAGGSVVWDVTTRNNPIRLNALNRNFQWIEKTTAGDYVATVDFSFTLRVFTTAGFITGALPAVELTDGPYRGLATDGTNFYSLKSNGVGGWRIVTVAPSGFGYTATVHSGVNVAMGLISNIRYGAGYLVVTGTDPENAWDLTLYRMSDGTPAPVLIPAYTGLPTEMSYFRAYYSRPPAGFVAPAYINILDGITFKSSSGKTYLVVAAKGIGDIYELRDANAVTVTASAPAKVYPGDKVTFVGTPSSSAVTQLVWTFGNPEAGIANTITQPPGVPVVHQYQSLTAASLGEKTVTASSISDLAVKGTTVVNVQMPTGKFAILGTGSKYIFTQPNASSPAPIVAGDKFVDASDGTADSHFVLWNLSGAMTRTLPGTPLDAGPCTAGKTLIFQSHYGPYDPATLTSLATTPLIVGLGPTPIGELVYAVRPFAAAVELLGADAIELVFQSASRAGADYLSIPVTFKWELVDNQNVVVPGAPSFAGVGFSALTTTPYRVAKTFAAIGRRARLTIDSTPLAAPCAGFEKSVSLSAPLNPPQPTIVGGCTGGGPPCTFTVNSAIASVNPDTDGPWQYQWSVSPAANVHLPSATSRSIIPIFKVANVSYLVSVTATNAFGQGLTSTTVIPTVAGTVCGSLQNSLAWNPTFSAPSGCTWNGVCTAGEVISFTASPFTYPDGNCAPHTFTWTFTPGGPQAAAHSTEPPYGSVPITRSFANGTYSVTLTVSNGAETGTYGPQSFSVGSPPPPPPPPTPPPPTGCATMSTSTVFINYNSASCSSSSTGACKTNEAISFSAYGYGYDFNCANHSFGWTFDGTPRSGANVSHTFTNDGTHNVFLTINRAGQTFATSVPITTGGGIISPPPVTGCATITPNISLFITYHNASNTCGALGAECERGDQLDFTVQEFGAYNITCANHTFEWDFGDGSARVNGRDVKHPFAAVGEFPVKCVVFNGTQTVTLEQKVKIKGDLPILIPVEADFTIMPIPGIANYSFTPRFNPASAVDHWVWNFGDGSPEVTRRGNPREEVHSYDKAESFTVTLKVYDSFNRELSSPRSYKVGGPRRRSARH